MWAEIKAAGGQKVGILSMRDQEGSVGPPEQVNGSIGNVITSHNLSSLGHISCGTEDTGSP